MMGTFFGMKAFLLWLDVPSNAMAHDTVDGVTWDVFNRAEDIDGSYQCLLPPPLTKNTIS